MSEARRGPMTTAEFLAWEERQDLRFEFDGTSVRAMTGGTAAHAAIQRNVLIALGNRLLDQVCEPYGSELKVMTPSGRIRYPDVFVVCTKPPPRATTVTDPVVVFEILSRSSVAQDLFVKSREYRSIPSVARYVVLQQTRPACVVFGRERGDWSSRIVAGTGALLRLPEIGVDLPLSDIYARIDFGSHDAPA